jgi:tetratricopeptide (TPR) repeat protein
MRIVFLVLIASFFSQIMEAQLASTLDSIIRAGYVKIENERYLDAIREFDKVLGVQPGNIPAMGGKISANINANRLREAQRLVDRALETKPGEPEYIFWRGVLSNAKKQYQKAIEDFDMVLAMAPASNILISRIYQNKAVSLSNLNQALEAFNILDQAIIVNPLNIGAYNERGLLLYRAENYQEALADFTRITEIDVTNNVAYYNKAMTYFRMKDKQNACVFFHRACELGNRNACQMIIMECQ